MATTATETRMCCSQIYRCHLQTSFLKDTFVFLRSPSCVTEKLKGKKVQPLQVEPRSACSLYIPTPHRRRRRAFHLRISSATRKVLKGTDNISIRTAENKERANLHMRITFFSLSYVSTQKLLTICPHFADSSTERTTKVLRRHSLSYFKI